MRRSYLIEVPGQPIAKKRHRDSKNGGKYNPSAADEKRILQCAKDQIDGVPMILGAVDLRVDFIFERPKSHFRSGRYSKLLKETSPQYHVSKPDLDNLVKLVKDALNGFMWNDDSQVNYEVCEKRYKGKHDEIVGAKTIIRVYER